MEKHKLIQLILKDLDELNEIANSLEQSQNISKFELDIALSKSKLVSQEFEFLKEISEKSVNVPIAEQQEVPVAPPLVATEKTEEKTIETISQPKVVEIKPVAAPNTPEHAQKQDETPAVKAKEAPQQPAPKIVQEKATIENSSENNEKEEIEEISSDQLKTVGEKFIHGKSLNDLILSSNSLDKKLASSPITKLEVAIGLNDRFQYTRELFDNNPELFHQTIQKIDGSGNLDEAVSYLNSNFKWKKTDTSIQFAQLVKRRFTN